MSNSTRDFLKKVQEDPALQNELRSRLGDPEAGIPTKDLAAFAAGKGYEFKVEELKGELSDDELGAVSGGALNAYIKIDHAIKLDGANKMYVKLSPFEH
jgi:predicted ribosomally synthesized peptide with nif11-like leader